jgi:hypothetical protein
MERLVGISKVFMKESCRRAAEQGQYHGSDPRLISYNNKCPTVDLDGYSSDVCSRPREWELGGSDQRDSRAISCELTQAANHQG